MGRYGDIAFTNSVKAMQRRHGSREAYARLDEDGSALSLEDDTRAFITARDSFYVATVSEKGWPYIQFRGGPVGFLKVLGPTSLGFADYRGNRQYITTGNLTMDDRVALFLMDYPTRRRLKLFGRMRAVEPGADPALIKGLTQPHYPGFVERALLVELEAYDWNCPRHITPRYTTDEIAREPALIRLICGDQATSVVTTTE